MARTTLLKGLLVLGIALGFATGVNAQTVQPKDPKDHKDQKDHKPPHKLFVPKPPVTPEVVTPTPCLDTPRPAPSLITPIPMPALGSISPILTPNPGLITPIGTPKPVLITPTPVITPPAPVLTFPIVNPITPISIQPPNINPWILPNPTLGNLAQNGVRYNNFFTDFAGSPNPLLVSPNLPIPFPPYVGPYPPYNPYNQYNPWVQNPYVLNPYPPYNPYNQYNPWVQNPYVLNPYLQNPYLQNPYLQNPYLQNPYVNPMYNPLVQNPYPPYPNSYPYIMMSTNYNPYNQITSPYNAYNYNFGPGFGGMLGMPGTSNANAFQVKIGGVNFYGMNGNSPMGSVNASGVSGRLGPLSGSFSNVSTSYNNPAYPGNGNGFGYTPGFNPANFPGNQTPLTLPVADPGSSDGFPYP